MNCEVEDASRFSSAHDQTAPPPQVRASAAMDVSHDPVLACVRDEFAKSVDQTLRRNLEDAQTDLRLMDFTKNHYRRAFERSLRELTAVREEKRHLINEAIQAQTYKDAMQRHSDVQASHGTPFHKTAGQDLLGHRQSLTRLEKALESPKFDLGHPDELPRRHEAYIRSRHGSLGAQRDMLAMAVAAVLSRVPALLESIAQFQIYEAGCLHHDAAGDARAAGFVARDVDDLHDRCAALYFWGEELSMQISAFRNRLLPQQQRPQDEADTVIGKRDSTPVHRRHAYQGAQYERQVAQVVRKRLVLYRPIPVISSTRDQRARTGWLDEETRRRLRSGRAVPPPEQVFEDDDNYPDIGPYEDDGTDPVRANGIQRQRHILQPRPQFLVGHQPPQTVILQPAPKVHRGRTGRPVAANHVRAESPTTETPKRKLERREQSRASPPQREPPLPSPDTAQAPSTTVQAKNSVTMLFEIARGHVAWFRLVWQMLPQVLHYALWMRHPQLYCSYYGLVVAR
ncbi:hypothetical protein EJ04DRAFT_586514 [Polyplosphaeria fusca]|uniref:Uncharacterized protein n=1 Tax=Polyplosphaeria fusca TaxID=682080 RepID=A0A9P4UYU3_9PLEO|nr:hypothetical protein EJ04DRAFT_586514 [Polyplosphaeria fusca]